MGPGVQQARAMSQPLLTGRHAKTILSFAGELRMPVRRGSMDIAERYSSSIAELAGLYAEVDRATTDFAAASGLRCPSGCGICCTRFTPTVSELEARYIADYLVSTGATDHAALGNHGGRPARTNSTNGVGCPFYDGVRHCTIYPARPLICRLFGFAGSRAKDGEMQFSVCREMPHPHGENGSVDAAPRRFRGAGIRVLGPVAPPDMQRAAIKLAGMPGGAGASGGRIDFAVRDALEAALLRNRLGRGPDTDDDTDPPNPAPDGIRPAA